jgi:hypothetical protein
MTKSVLQTVGSSRSRNARADQRVLDPWRALGDGWRCFVLFLFLFAASIICSAKQGDLPEARTQQLEPCGLFSDLRVPPLLVPISEPTAIRIMPSRYRDLWQARDGYDRTGIDLVAYDGTSFTPAGLSDDSGIYYYIVLISRTFHLSLARSISVFFVTVLALAVAAGCSGLLLVLRSWPSRIVGLVALSGLTLLAYRLGDVYLFEFALPVALIPWVVRQVRQRTHDWYTNVLFAAVGVVIGLGATVRTAAGIPTLVLVLVLVATQFQIRSSGRIVLACLVLAGALCPVIFLHHLEGKRDSFLLKQTAIHAEDLSRHTFWHFTYIGLGFVSNPYVPGGVCDEIGKAKVRAIAPEVPYLSRRYDDILRHEVILIAAEHPSLVLFTIAAKLGIVVVIVAVFASVGLVAAFFRPIDKSAGAIFGSALLAAGLPVLLVAPSPQYLMSLITLAGMYGVFGLDGALQPVLARVRAVDLGHAKHLNWWSSVKGSMSV